MNKKQIMQEMNGKNVKRHLENYLSNDERKQEVLKALKDKGIDESRLTEDDSFFMIEGFTQIIRKEKRKQDEIKALKFRSSDYMFENCHGDIPKAENFFENDNEIGFFIVDFNDNKIIYTLEKSLVK
jgi:hypothetical protein